MGMIDPILFGEEAAPWYDLAVSSQLPTDQTVRFLADIFTSATSVVEIGAGTGRVAIPLAEAAGVRVLATDISPAMLMRIEERRGGPDVDCLLHDIVESDLPGAGQHDGIYCLFNTLFMLGDDEAQDQALERMRRAVAPGAALVLEFFQPNDAAYESDFRIIEPQHIDERSLVLHASVHEAAKRRVVGQNLRISEEGTTLSPYSMHYRLLDDLVAAALRSGWQFESCFGDWSLGKFTKASMNCVCVLRASPSTT